MRENNMFIFGTAGHIDHGKTALIQALTSIDTDRLPEEKARGMTIDLGFAWLNLKSGGKVGIIDVPGHENYIKNMIVGATAIDAAILVIDVKEGWMPQTEEHFQILKMLDLKYGLIVLTKIDLADEEQIDLVEKKVRERVKDSFLGQMPIIRISVHEQSSIEELKSAIEKMSQKMIPQKDIGKPKLCIDRVFNIKGSGTVVTGTLVGGSLGKGQEVTIFPLNRKVRIRNLQSYKEQLDQVFPGNRVALNLTGVKKDELRRGDIIFGIKQIKSSKNVDVEIKLIAQGKEFFLKHGTELVFFSGTKEISAKVILFGKKFLKSGEIGFAQLRFSEPMVLDIADRFILRLPSPSRTIGGGIVLDPLATKHSFKDNNMINILQRRLTSDLRESVLSELEKIKLSKKVDFLVNSKYSSLEIEKEIRLLEQEGKLYTTNSWIIDIKYWQKQIEKMVNFLSQQHQKYPLEKGFPLSKLQSHLDFLVPELFNSLINHLLNSNQISLKNGIVFLPTYKMKFSLVQKLLISEILKKLKENPINPPTEKEIINQIEGSKELVRYLYQNKKIVKLDDDILLMVSHYRNMRNKIIEFLKSNHTISIGEVRNLLGISRKYIVPLLTRMDQEGVTQRKGDVRILLKNE